jgi:DNA polymerase-3 subunit delta'
MSFSSIVGHRNQIEILKKVILNDRVSHAYLFLGPEGVGKKQIAFAFAKALNCRSFKSDSCNSCLSCKKTDSKNHPDVDIIDHGNKFIKIDSIREMQRKLQYKPLEGRFKISIIDRAELINISAANALLKTLEEPPDQSIIILIASNVNNLLPTLNSRCQKLTFSFLQKDEVTRLIKKQNLEDEIGTDFLVTFAQGSIGKALSFESEWINTERKKFLNDTFSVVQGDMEKAFQMTEEIYLNENLMNYLDILKIWFRDILVYKYCNDDTRIINTDLIDSIKRSDHYLSHARLLSMFQVVTDCSRNILRNANKRLTLEAMFMKLGNPEPPETLVGLQ